MGRTNWITALVAAGALVASARSAGAQEQPWRLRIGPSSVRSSHDLLMWNVWLGFGADLEYRLSPRLGVDVGVLTANVQDPGFDFFGIDVDTELRITPVVARLNVHLTPDSPVDLHVAPVAAWVKTGEATVHTRVDLFGDVDEKTVRVPVDDQLVWGAALGFDVPLRGSSYLTFEATYLDLDLDLDLRDPHDRQVGFWHLDPLFVQVGYGVRF
ncbi:MAG TPA: hypothetical protein VGV61_08620 [Thermoanaerobaculia bacterium]|jgi:hypothetical protein|nr:hypothetical protein [Thermoanaerobaculia bacterium]